MLLTLIGKRGIYKLVLPQVAIGNYWISDKTNEVEKKLINIEGKNGKWQITTNRQQKIINPEALDINDNSIQIKKSEETVMSKAILEDNNSYCICLGNLNDIYVLYCSPSYENNFYHLDINNTNEITIGGNKKNSIMYDNKFVSTRHAILVYNQGRWNLENLDKKFGTIVNNERVFGTQILLNGDIIFIMGLKIIVIGKTIYINNPLNKMACNREIFSISTIKNEKVKEIFDNDEEIEIYSENDYFSRAPRLTNRITHEVVTIDSPPAMQSNEETPMILVIGTSLTMGIMSMVTLTRTIDNAVSGTATGKETAYQLIIAIAMLVSMLIFPMVNKKYERIKKKKYEEKRQKRYGDYVKSKMKTIEQIMEKQRNILSENYVSPEECIKIILNREGRLWERKIEEFDFLTIRLRNRKYTIRY